MIVDWHPAARAELEDILAGSLEFGTPALAGLMEAVDAATWRLAEHPHHARPGRRPETRELVPKRYPFILVYRIKPDRVTIMSIRHAARRWPQRFPD